MVATGVGVFIMLFGPWGVSLETLARRAFVDFSFAWIGSLLGLATARIVSKVPGIWTRTYWLGGVATGVLMMPPMCAVVYGVQWIAQGHPPHAGVIPEMAWQVLLISVAASIIAVVISRRTVVVVAPEAPPPPKFLERLPLKLRGAEVWAVEAEDHYLRLHTSKGQDLILMRLADAIAELEGIEGAQTHRSWWVARDAIVDARRGDGRATLTLKDGAEVPVSRTYAGALRERGWI